MQYHVRSILRKTGILVTSSARGTKSIMTGRVWHQEQEAQQYFIAHREQRERSGSGGRGYKPSKFTPSLSDALPPARLCHLKAPWSPGPPTGAQIFRACGRQLLLKAPQGLCFPHSVPEGTLCHGWHTGCCRCLTVVDWPHFPVCKFFCVMRCIHR